MIGLGRSLSSLRARFGGITGARVLALFAQGMRSVAGASRRVARAGPFCFVLAVCVLFSLRALFAPVMGPLGGYDDALLFLNAQMMDDGRVIYRDFYSNYPPGIFQLVRVLSALGIPTIWGMRALTLIVHVTSAVLAGRLVATTWPRDATATSSRHGRFSGATMVCVLALQSRLGCLPFAYPFALLLLQIALFFWPQPGGSTRRFLVCGILLGVLSYVRHDLFVYSIAVLCLGEALRWFLRRESLFFASPKEAIRLIASTTLVVLVLWVPIIARAGLMRVLNDLVFDVSRITMPARVLPIPPLTVKTNIPSLNLALPAFLAERTAIILALTGASLLVSLFFAARALLVARHELDRRRRNLLLFFLLALATVPQALGRTDYWHVAYGLPLVLAAAAGAWQLGVVRFVAVAVAVLPWFSHGTYFTNWAVVRQFLSAPSNPTFLAPADKIVADYLQTHTAPGEAIFVGCASHQRLTFAPLSPYYWAHRPGATRFMQLDPGLATEVEGQTAMVQDLERTRPRLVLRYSRCWWEEPNRSRLPGASLLDEYLAAHYAHHENIGAFAVHVRREPNQANPKP